MKLKCGTVKKLTSRGQFPFHRRSRTVSVFFSQFLCYPNRVTDLFAQFFEKLTVFAKTERIQTGPYKFVCFDGDLMASLAGTAINGLLRIRIDQSTRFCVGIFGRWCSQT